MHRAVQSCLVVLVAASSAEAAPKAKKPTVPSMEVSNVIVTPKEPPFGEGGHYIEVQFDVTVNRPPSAMTLPQVKAVCRVGTKKLADKGGDIEQLNEVEAGETIRVSGSPFLMTPLEERPTMCDLTISASPMFGKDQKLGQFCWSDNTVSAGPCPK
jgi:hypothetical protein